MGKSKLKEVTLQIVWMTSALFCGPLILMGAVNDRSHLDARSSLIWVDSFEKAKQISKKEGKPIVLFFTGSDWCSWCTRLKREVFESTHFVERAKDQYLFVEIDFPMHRSFSNLDREANERLRDIYHVKGYPTLVIVDHKGSVVAETGYKAGGGEKYAQHLESILEPHWARFSSSSDTKGPVAVLEENHLETSVRSEEQAPLSEVPEKTFEAPAQPL